MSNLNITLVQANQIWEDKTANLLHYENLLATVAETDLILLPEMFQTGFTMNAAAMAENMDTGSSISWLKARAKEKNAAFYTSLIIEENGNYFNRGVFVEPDGTLTTYDKRKLFGMADESTHFTPGNKEVIVDYRGWKINLQICYDLRFPEIVRNELLEGTPKYDLIVYVANWPERRSHHWKSLLMARAIENQCYVAGVNRIGKDANNLSYSGDSTLINLLGEVKSTILPFTEITETLIMYKLNLTELREKLPFLKDK